MASDAAAEEEAGWPSEKGSYPVFPANVVVVFKTKKAEWFGVLKIEWERITFPFTFFRVSGFVHREIVISIVL